MKQPGDRSSSAGHEHLDADVPGVALAAGLVLLLVAISFLTVRGLLIFLDHRSAALLAERPVTEGQFPPPRLQVDAIADLRAARSASNLELHSYGWIDRKAGIARIPIERAMQLLIERGLPDVGAGQTRLQLMQARPQTNPKPNERLDAPTGESPPP